MACSWTLTAASLLPRFPHRVTKCHVPQVYSPLDWSQGLLFLMAVGTVVAGSLWAATDEAAARGRQRKDGSGPCEAGAEAADGSEPLVAATARQVGNLVDSLLEGAEPLQHVGKGSDARWQHCRHPPRNPPIVLAHRPAQHRLSSLSRVSLSRNCTLQCRHKPGLGLLRQQPPLLSGAHPPTESALYCRRTSRHGCNAAPQRTTPPRAPPMRSPPHRSSRQRWWRRSAVAAAAGMTSCT